MHIPVLFRVYLKYHCLHLVSESPSIKHEQRAGADPLPPALLGWGVAALSCSHCEGTKPWLG